MTLERSLSVTTFTADNQVKTYFDAQTLIDSERGYRTISTTPKSGSASRAIRRDQVTAATGLKPLAKSASEQTFVTCSSNTAFSKTVWPSEDFGSRHLSPRSTPLRNGTSKLKLKIPPPSSSSKRRHHHQHCTCHSYLQPSPGSVNNNNCSNCHNHYDQHQSKPRHYKKRPENRRSTFTGSHGELALDSHSVPPQSASCRSLGDATCGKYSTESRSVNNGSKTAPATLPLNSPQTAKSCAFSYIFSRSRKSRSRHRESSSTGQENCRPRASSERPASAIPRVDSTSSSFFQLPLSSPNGVTKRAWNTETEDSGLASKSRSNSKDHVSSLAATQVKGAKDPAVTDASERLIQQQDRSIQRQDRSRSDRRPQYPSVPRDRSEDAFYRNPHSERVDSRTNEDRKREDTAQSTSAGTRSLSVSGGASASSSSRKQTRIQNGSRTKSQHSLNRTADADDEYCHSSSNCDSSSTRSQRRRLNFRGLGIYNPESDCKVINDAEDFEYLPSDMKGPLNLSFCGCGFLGMYHLGVATCLVQRAPSLLDRVEKVGGASAGALMAAILVTCPEKMEDCGVLIQNLSKEIRSKPLGALTPGYTFTRSMRTMLHSILPDHAHLEAKGKLFVSLTDAVSKKNEMISDFTDKEEFIEALIASCHVPVYAGMKYPVVRGKKFVDGGLSNNMLKFDVGRTITVSPFDGKSDIGPKQGQEADKKAHFINLHNQDFQVNIRNFRRGAHAFFPPRRHVLQEYFEKGRFDASRFLIREGLYEINPPSKPKKVVYESSV